MAKFQTWLPRFDKSQVFVVRKPMTISGRPLKSGDTFDPTLVSERRLRQLYEQRWIVVSVAPEQTGREAVKEVVAPVNAKAPRGRRKAA